MSGYRKPFVVIVEACPKSDPSKILTLYLSEDTGWSLAEDRADAFTFPGNSEGGLTTEERVSHGARVSGYKVLSYRVSTLHPPYFIGQRTVCR
jgi:hypothetical protein